MSPTSAQERLGELGDRTAVLRAVLEEALVTWGRSKSAAWEVQVRAASDHLTRAVVGDAADLLEAVEPVGAALSAALSEEGLPPELASMLREAIAFTRETRELAIEAVVRAPAAPRDVSTAVDRPFRASVGVPTAHVGLELPSPDVLPGAYTSDIASIVAAELGALAQRGALVRGLPEAGDDDDETRSVHNDRAAPASAPRGESLQLARIARDCLEDLATLAGLRRARDEDAWGDAERFDARILASLDALVSLDLPRSKRGTKLGVVDFLWTYATQWSAPDAGRAFAFAFVLSCLDASDAARWVLLALRGAPERVHPAFEDALALGSNPAIDGSLRDLVSQETRPDLLGLALRVIRRRGSPDVPSLLPLLGHPDQVLARAAVWALSAAPKDEIEAPFVWLLDGEPRVAIAAASTLAAAGSKDAVRHLRAALERARSDQGEAARAAGLDAGAALSVMGEARDAEALEAMARVQPELLPWLGIHGFASHLPALLMALERDGIGPGPRAVARAIHRITGLHPGGWRPSDRTDLGVSPWRECLATTQEWPTTRLRSGRHHAPGWRGLSTVLDELADGATLQGDRRRLEAELSFAMGRPSALDVDGWSARQLARLGELGRDAG